MKSNRKDHFNLLRTRLVIENKCIELKWCEKISDLAELSDNYHFDKDYAFLNFGACKIFGSLEVSLSTTKLTNNGLRFTEIGGALNTNDEAKELHQKLENIFGKADYYSESDNEIYTYWEDENTKIIIYPKHHMGGEWFEYRIMTKNCT
jgi:hypothetical protein